jgi:hypothetical protein
MGDDEPHLFFIFVDFLNADKRTLVKNVCAAVVVDENVLECLADHIGVMLKSLREDRPQPALLRRYLLVKVFADLFEILVEQRLATHDADHFGISHHRINGPLDLGKRHEIRFWYKLAETGAVPTRLWTRIRYLNLNGVHVK